MGVKALHRDYEKYSPKWKRARDVLTGQDAVHAAGTAYLPKLQNEEQADYDGRLKRSDFWNGSWRTVDALGGMIFRRPPSTDLPAAIEPMLADVTLSGMSMESLAKEVVEEVLGLGRIGILIDHPPSETDEEGKVVSITQAVAEQRGIRPTMQLYMAESIRNWKFARINNAWVLSQVVLGEKHEQPKNGDEFETECVDRYRVLDLGGANGTYRQRVFEVKDDKDIQIGGDIVPLMNGQPLDFIPFTFVGTGGANDAIDEPPLIDLIDANLALYQINAIYRHTLYFCPPTFYIAGYTLNDGEKISIGGTAALVFPDPNAKAEYAEPEGSMVPELLNATKEKKQEMAALGAQMLVEKSATQKTATEAAINMAGENSVLAKIVTSVSESLEWALSIFAKWAGHEAEIVYQLNRDFLPTMMDAQQLNALFAGVQSGNISRRECFELLQRGDVIDGAKDYEEHQREIDEEAPTLAMPKPKPGEQKPEPEKDEAA